MTELGLDEVQIIPGPVTKTTVGYAHKAISEFLRANVASAEVRIGGRDGTQVYNTLKHYVRRHGLPVGVARRGTATWLFRV